MKSIRIGGVQKASGPQPDVVVTRVSGASQPAEPGMRLFLGDQVETARQMHRSRYCISTIRL
jgi:hypothetical protein